jgi:hypothetical protein
LPRIRRRFANWTIGSTLHERRDLGHDKLRAALEQRAEQWKADLRAEPRVARMLLRQLVGPLTLWDESEPDFVKWTAKPTTGLLDGLATLLDSSPAGFEPALPA